ncbi:beta-glucanase [Ginsengibacter hankyongi]|uniref:Glucanase n=2 Tax=Ginsengibacter hankyongi TaxID=2607284 RepID=A0A5J5IJD9_9BACT|nr:beta-glucanase [Ginsengibacter hankyongi]
MFRPIKFITFFFVFVLMHKLSAAQQVSKPFPQHVSYAGSTIKPNHVSQQQLDDSVASFYNKWKERYINDDAGEGQYYVWVEGSVASNQCVSEGQGYGMIIVALMAGYDTAAQKIYNGLYKYYKLHPSKNSPYLMAWAQTKTFKDYELSSATDGDMDIAYSLLLANAQWGSKGKINYLQEAQSMIAAILQQEINSKTFSVLLSNAVEYDSKDYFDMRSSDFMPAHFKAFGKATNNKTWNKVIDANYKLFNFMQKKFSGDAGLLPDFIEHINTKPVPAKPHYLESKYDGKYNYNACRVPWRIATDFIINGESRSKKIVSKINKWIRETTQENPDNISAGYTLEGDDIHKRYYEAMSFIAPFAVSAMVDAKNQIWLNKLWDYIVSFDIDRFDYFDNTIKMISMIILSGNYWAP